MKSSVVTKWSTNFEHSESLMKMDFRTSVVHVFYQFCASRKFTNRCREQTKRRGAPMHRSTRISQVLASVHFVSLCSSRREKSALKYTLIESLFMRLQRDMLSNFLSLSDLFLIHYKTRKRPLNTIENFDTPSPTHAGEIRFLAGFEIK